MTVIFVLTSSWLPLITDHHVISVNISIKSKIRKSTKYKHTLIVEQSERTGGVRV